MFNLLVVEDDPHVRSLIKAILTDEGYNCITASDGIDALDAMDNHHVDLAIVDIMMPRMDGIRMTMKLRLRVHKNTARRQVRNSDFDAHRKNFARGQEKRL